MFRVLLQVNPFSWLLAYKKLQSLYVSREQEMVEQPSTLLLTDNSNIWGLLKGMMVKHEMLCSFIVRNECYNCVWYLNKNH